MMMNEKILGKCKRRFAGNRNKAGQEKKREVHRDISKEETDLETC